jgi:putative transcriptional regulator
MGKKYRSDALAAVHETAFGLTEAGVMDKRTMKVFDEMCLTPVEELTAKQIRQIRMREKASQEARLCLLAISTSQPGSSANGSAVRNTRAAPR